MRTRRVTGCADIGNHLPSDYPLANGDDDLGIVRVESLASIPVFYNYVIGIPSVPSAVFCNYHVSVGGCHDRRAHRRRDVNTVIAVDSLCVRTADKRAEVVANLLGV